jgi:hypothetical protein
MTTTDTRTAPALFRAAPVLLEPDEWLALVTLVADVHHGHGRDPHLRTAAGAAWGLLSDRCLAASGCGVAVSPERDRERLEVMTNRPRPWWRARS